MDSGGFFFSFGINFSRPKLHVVPEGHLYSVLLITNIIKRSDSLVLLLVGANFRHVPPGVKPAPER